MGRLSREEWESTRSIWLCSTGLRVRVTSLSWFETRGDRQRSIDGRSSAKCLTHLVSHSEHLWADPQSSTETRATVLRHSPLSAQTDPPTVLQTRTSHSALPPSQSKQVQYSQSSEVTEAKARIPSHSYCHREPGRGDLATRPRRSDIHCLVGRLQRTHSRIDYC